MTTFEYLTRQVELYYSNREAHPTFVYREGTPGNYTMPSIDELGKQGWELISLILYEIGTVAVFKRQRQA